MTVKAWIEEFLWKEKLPSPETEIRLDDCECSYTVLELCLLLMTQSIHFPDDLEEKQRIAFQKKAVAYIEANTPQPEENTDFRAGVMDAFCEIVAAGVKKIAFSHATDDEELFQSDLMAACYCTKKYQIDMYIEKNLVETLLLKNSGSKVIIFYRDPEDIEDYVALKSWPQRMPEEKTAAAKELGRLLSYHPKRVEDMIEKRLKETEKLP